MSIALNDNLFYSYGASPAVWDMRYLPPRTSEGAPP